MKVVRRDRQDAAHLWRLCVVNGSVDDGRVRGVVGTLSASARPRARAILSHFVRLMKQGVAQRAARVESAVALDAGERADVERSVARRYGPATTMTFDVQPSLIGGLRVTVGSDVYDGSVRGRLDALAASFGEQP
jgi:F-type H+-transporting ATPase subunit delta